MPELFRSVREIAERYGLLVVSYGHAADGNIHVNIVEPPGERERWLANRDGAIREIFRCVVAIGGTITGEHGVGLTQRSLDPAPSRGAGSHARRETGLRPRRHLEPRKDLRVIRLSRTIHFNVGRSLWRSAWSEEKNRAVYGEEGPHGYGHNYVLELSSERERLARFEQEARSASALNRPNIVTIYEIGQADSSPLLPPNDVAPVSGGRGAVRGHGTGSGE